MDEFGVAMFLFGLWIGLNIGVPWGEWIGSRLKNDA